MYIVKPVEIETWIEGLVVAIQFTEHFMQLEPGKQDQHVTTCYLRPMDGGPKRMLVGVAVCHMNDVVDGDYGKKLALARAIESIWASSPGWTHKQAWYLARRTIREWHKEQQEREMLRAVDQELRRIKVKETGELPAEALADVMAEKAQELEAAGSRLAAERLGATDVAAAATGLPAGPVSQFLSK